MNVKQPYVLAAIAISIVVIVVIIFTSSNRKASANEEKNGAIISNNLFSIPKLVKNWPEGELELGQVSGVSVNSQLQPVIFHRADRVFDQFSFNATGHFQQISDGPITRATVLTLDPNNGKVIAKWGENKFYLPHGLTIDKHDNMWITDVGMHQGFMFKRGENEPSLVFGQKFQPGSDEQHLCKPTTFAIANNGEIFLADGYCNSRVLKYTSLGKLIRIIPSQNEVLPLYVPHGLAILESLDRICIADRENMRVVCPRAGLSSEAGIMDPPLTIQEPDMGKIYDVAAKGNIIYAVNGPTTSILPIEGLTIDPLTEKVIDRWGPLEGFSLPHAIAICPNGSSLYVSEINPNKIWKFELKPHK